MTNGFVSALLRWIDTTPDAPFCRQIGRDQDVLLRWRDLADDMGRFGAAYRGAGLAAGDQVLIFLRHVPDLYGSFFGAMTAGLVPAFMPCTSPRQDPTLYWSSHRELLATIRPAAIVIDRSTLVEMTAAGLDLAAIRVVLIEETDTAPLMPVDMPTEAIGLLQHSSGTTGLKKGVALSYGAIVAQLERYHAALAIGEDSFVSWLPLYHDMGLVSCLLLPAWAGRPMTHIDPFLWVGRPGSLLDAIVEEGGTLCWLPNFAFEHLALTVGRRAAGWDLSGIRAFVNCSEPVKPATFDRFIKAFSSAGVRAEQLQCCYAMAETVFAVSQTMPGRPCARLTVDPSTVAAGAVPIPEENGLELLETGTPIADVTLSFHLPDGTIVPDGTVGEIAIRAPFLFDGYNRDPARTGERLIDGRYFTRDIGFLREGRLYVLGRTDDLVIINGRNLYAHEVEASLAGIEGLKPGRAVAVAEHDARLGSQVLIVIAERAVGIEIDEGRVVREVTDRVSAIFEVVPRTVELIDGGELVKTTSGKISRSKNLERHIARRMARVGA